MQHPEENKGTKQVLERTGGNPIRAITFDFWDTLYYDTNTREARRQLIAQALEEVQAGVDLERLDAAKALAWSKFKQARTSDNRIPSVDEWLAWVLGDLRVTLARSRQTQLIADIKQAVLQEGPVPLPGARACVARLSERYILAIISDAIILSGADLRQVLARDGLLPHFRHTTFSDELGCSKPHPRAFLATLEALAVSPAETVHIGDLPETDIFGAQRVGMRTIQFVGGRYPHDSAAIHADAVLKDYDHLESLLEAISRSTGITTQGGCTE